MWRSPRTHFRVKAHRTAELTDLYVNRRVVKLGAPTRVAWGVTQEMNSALHVVELERHRADLVISIEVAEHIPASSHQMFVKALASRSRKWLLFSAAVPGAGFDTSAGLGHISCRTPRAWRELIEMHSPFIFNAALTHAVQEAAGSVRQALGLHKAHIADIYLRNGVMVFEK